MKTLTTPLSEMQAERIAKGPDFIIGYVGESEVFAFRGVSDFSGFVLDGEWDPPQTSLEQMVAELQATRKRLDAAEEALMGMLT